MWIRSQNKRCLVDIKGCFVDDDYSWKEYEFKKEHKYNIVGWMCESSAGDNQQSLGMYKTKEKAMKVLDELQCRIARTESGVFQMPEDDE